MKNIRRIIFLVALMVFAFGAGVSFADFGFNSKKQQNAYALTSTASTNNVGDILRPGSSKVFNSDNLNKLYQAITGKTGATYADVSALVDGSEATALFGDKVVRSSLLYQKAGNKDITLTFGGFEWTVTAVSKTRGGDVVATLWILNSATNGVQSMKYNQHGNGGTYPTNIYGTSYIRAIGCNSADIDASGNVTTNTVYSPNASTLTTAPQNASHKYAKFSMPGASDSLTQFLVQPKDILYQEKQSMTYFSPSWSTCVNDAWGTPSAPVRDTILSSYTGKPKYTDWKYDYIWIPSSTEGWFQDFASTKGIWDLTSSQRNVGAQACWRSGNGGGSTQCDTIGSTGNLATLPTTNTYLVLPAVHLNLKQADAHKREEFKDPQNVITTYDGTNQTLATLATQPTWYDADLKDTTKITITPPANMKNAGEYWVKAEINASYNNSLPDAQKAIFEGTADTSDVSHMESDTVRWFKFTIEKKKVGATFGTDSATGFPTVTVNTADVCAGDTGNDAPQLGLKYSGVGYPESTTAPTNAGAYTAKAYIINDTCNYVLKQDYTKDFTKEKNKITKPIFDRTTENYDNTDHVFTVNNFDSTKYTMTGPAGVTISNNTATIKNAGKYMITFALIDTTNDQWKKGDGSGEGSANYQIQIEINKKLLNVGFEVVSGFNTNYEFGLDPNANPPQTSPQLKVTTENYTTDDVVLYIYYYNATTPATKYDLSGHIVVEASKQARTVTFPLNDIAHPLSLGTYTFAVQLVPNEAVNKNYYIATASDIREKVFKVIGAQATWSGVTWQRINTADITDKEVIDTTVPSPGFEYTGKEYLIKIDETLLVGIEVDVNKVGAPNGYMGLTKVTDVGTYSITVWLKVATGYTKPTGMPDSVQINFEITQAKYDLSNLKWVNQATNAEYNATNGLEYTGADITVILDGLSAISGLTPSYTGNVKRNIGNYSAGITFINSNNNYVTPDENDPTSYIYNGGTFPWSLSWKIVKAKLNGVWDMSAVTGSFGSGKTGYFIVPKLKPVGSLNLHNMVDYKFWILDENSVKQPIPDADVNKIGTLPRECVYFVKATLKTTYDPYYTLTATEQRFTIGRDLNAIQLTTKIGINGGTPEPIKLEYNYGDTLVVDSDIIIGDTTPSLKSNLVYTYYKCQKVYTGVGDFHNVIVGVGDGSDGYAITMGNTIPTDVGNYHCVISLNGAPDSMVGNTCNEFLFAIVPKVIDISSLKWKWQHDAKNETTQVDETLTGTYDKDGLKKWTDASDAEILKFVYNSKDHIFKFDGFDTLSSKMLSATITCDDPTNTAVVDPSSGSVTFKNATYAETPTKRTSATIKITFTFSATGEDAKNYVVPNQQVLDITIERATLDLSKMQWGYLGEDLKDHEFKDKSVFTFKRASKTAAVDHTVKLIGVPEELQKHITYTNNINSNVGVYKASYTLGTGFNKDNYVGLEAFDTVIPKTFSWSVEPKRVKVPKLDTDPQNKWTVFDDEEHSLIDGLLKVENNTDGALTENLTTDNWDLYYTITVTKDGQPFTGLGTGKEYVLKDSGIYKIKFQLLPDVTGKNVFWKDYVNEITLTVEKLKVNVKGWKGSGVNSETVMDPDKYNDSAEFGKYFEYVYFEQKPDGTPDPAKKVANADVASKTNVKLVKVVKLLDDLTKPGAIQNVELIGDVTHEFEIGAIAGVELIERPFQDKEVYYIGSLILVTEYLANFNQYIMEIVEIKDEKGEVVAVDGTIITELGKLLKAGKYTIRIHLLNPAGQTNFMWKAPKQKETATETKEDIDVDFEIKKMVIKGSWQVKKDIPEFVLEQVEGEPDLSDKIKVTYYDMDGNEVDKKKFVAGTKYVAKVSLVDPENTEFFSDDPEVEDPTPIDYEFTYKALTPAEMANKAMDFVKDNWLYFLIGAIALLLLLLFLAKRRKKDGDDETASLKHDLERAELERRLAEARNGGNNNGGGNQMPMFNPYMMFPPPQPPQQQGGSNNADKAELLMQKEEIARLKDSIANDNRNSDKEEIRKLREELEKQKENQKIAEQKAELEKLKEEVRQANSGHFAGKGMPMPMMPPYNPYQDEKDKKRDSEMQELRDAVTKLTKFQMASQEEKNQNSRLANVENMLQQFLMSNFRNTPNWVPFNNQDMINYDMNDLMRIYGQAKDMAQKNMGKSKHKNQIIIDEAEDFENKVNEYNRQKDNSRYEELLREMRDLKEDNKELKEQLESNKIHQAEKELADTKQELLKREAEIEKMRESKQVNSQPQQNNYELELTRQELFEKQNELNRRTNEYAKTQEELARRNSEFAKSQEEWERRNNEYAKNKEELARSQEELARRNSEYEKNKEAVARSQEELARKQGEVESLKAQNEKQEKLIEELVKKNETMTTDKTPQKDVNTTTNLIVNTGVTNTDKLEFVDAFNYLKEEQKKYFTQLRDYALSQENARIKPTKYNFTVGIGNSTFIKFVVKYSTLIAVFGTTEIKLENATAFETAKQMIDNKVKEYLKEKNKK